MKKLALTAEILKITMYVMVICTIVYLFSTYEPERPVECIHWDGFTKRYKIETKQTLSTNGAEYYLDNHGQVVLVRPVSETAKKQLTQSVK
ncbi:MAG: hypothetical protein ACRBG0_19215 [Lewinella sp.]|uniref:hypothetical protein n=1 Tax=Lewinella sp. TaxID=2004506 RepID=UPI003D6A1E4F